MTKEDLQQIKELFDESFAENFDRSFDTAFDRKFPKAFADATATPAFATTIREIVRPDFDQVHQDISEFKDQVLAREDRTLKELLSIRQEPTFLGARVTRLENHPKLA